MVFFVYVVLPFKIFPTFDTETIKTQTSWHQQAKQDTQKT